MFEEASVYVLSSENEIYRLELDRELQNSICEMFSSSAESLVCGKKGHVFSGNYKPEEDEYLKIENFQLRDVIKDAIRNPLGVKAYEKDPDIRQDGNNDNMAFPDIRALFTGERIQENKTEKFNIAFQRYRREQNIVALPFRLNFSNHTFKQDKQFGIGIGQSVDCVFTGNELQFNSFFFARQIFDLSSYYRSATDSEVASFTKNKMLEFENAEEFTGLANSYVRRKIAMINDSKVLEKYKPSELQELGNKIGLTIVLRNDKVFIPSDKEEALIVVGFLDEEAYQGPFSKNILLANSKRVVKKSQ